MPKAASVIILVISPSRRVQACIGILEDSEVATTVEIQEKVMQIVCEQMSVEKSELSRETSFVNDLNADSLDTVELVMELEDEFDLTIPDEEAEKLKTVGSAIDYIQAHIEGKS